LVYEHYLDSNYHLNLSAYQYRVQGLISQVDTDAGEAYYANVDAVRARGVEAEVEAKYQSGVLIRASYILQRAKDDTSGQELTSSPQQLAKLNLSVPVRTNRLFANVELQYQSSSRALSGRQSPAFLLTNLSLTTDKLWPHLRLSAVVQNAFNAAHVYPAAEEHLQDTLQLYGRTYLGKIVVRF
jgi:outer membrane receptor protein involved in Fe transport